MIIRPLIAPLITLAAILVLVSSAFAATETMRLDYYHSGDAAQEIFSVDRIVIEPLPWPGHPSQAIDTSNMGKYVFEVRDAKQSKYSTRAGSRRFTGSGRRPTKPSRSSARFRSHYASPRPRRQSTSSSKNGMRRTFSRRSGPRRSIRPTTLSTAQNPLRPRHSSLFRRPAIRKRKSIS